MPPFPNFAVRQLQRSDVPLMGAMMTVFGDAFKEADTYTGAPPSAAYLERLLGGSHLIALAATKHGVVVGGLVAYELSVLEGCGVAWRRNRRARTLRTRRFPDDMDATNH
jgi:aminoglycoside 3-N-acetyltransferase I